MGATRTGGEGEVGGAGEATTKAGGASAGGCASTLEAFFANLVLDGALVLVTEHLEGFGDLRGVSSRIFEDEETDLFELFGRLL